MDKPIRELPPGELRQFFISGLREDADDLREEVGRWGTSSLDLVLQMTDEAIEFLEAWMVQGGYFFATRRPRSMADEHLK